MISEASINQMWDQLRELTNDHFDRFGNWYHCNKSFGPVYAGIRDVDNPNLMSFSKDRAFKPEVGDQIICTKSLPFEAWEVLKVVDKGFTWLIHRRPTEWNGK